MLIPIYRTDLVKQYRSDGRTPLSSAIQGGYKGLVKLLLERGDVDPNSPDDCGRTAPSFSAELGDEGAVQLLLKCRNVPPDLPDRNSQTPLSFAAGKGRERVVKLLLKLGDPNSSDREGQTPL